jgi:hypothetical protein
MKIAKILAGLLVITLLFAGCGQTGDVSPSPSPSAPPEATSEPTEDKGEVLYTVGGKNIYADELKFWVFRALASAYLSAEDEIDWDEADVNGMTLAEFVKGEAVQGSKVFKAVEDKAKELNLTFTDEEKAYLDNVKNEVLTTYFDDDSEALEKYLSDNGISDAMLRYQEEIPILYNKIIDATIGANGENVSDADAIAWGVENGVFRAKHILFKTKTDDRVTPLSDDLIALAKEAADNLYAELSEITDRAELLSTYDIKMQNMSEDPGAMTNPDGYQFIAGQMREEFTSAIQGLADYALSEPVDIVDGYSIMLRLPLDPEMELIGGSGTLRTTVANVQINEMIDSWTSVITVEYSDAFENIDLNAVIGK